MVDLDRTCVATGVTFALQMDAAGRFRTMHRDLAVAMGYAVGDFALMSLYDLVHADDLESLGEALFKVQAGEGPASLRVRLRDAEGGFYWVDIVDWGFQTMLRVAGRHNPLRDVRIRLTLTALPCVGPAQFVVGHVDETTQHVTLGYSKGISVGQLQQLLAQAIPEKYLARVQRFIAGLMVSDAGDLPPDFASMIDGPTAQGEPVL